MATRLRRAARRSTPWARLQRAPWFLILTGAIIAAGLTYLGLSYLLTAFSPLFSLPTSLRPPAAQLALPQLGALLWLIFGVVGAVRSWRHQHYRQQLLRRARHLADIQALSWQDFELLVGQLYRRHGYHVTEVGLGGADGGIDLIAQKWGSGEKLVVQCKHYRQRAVGAPVVRELYGLMVHHRATGAAVICCGHFTAAARAFAQDKPLALVGADQLLRTLAQNHRSVLPQSR